MKSQIKRILVQNSEGDLMETYLDEFSPVSQEDLRAIIKNGTAFYSRYYQKEDAMLIPLSGDSNICTILSLAKEDRLFKRINQR